MFQDTHLTTKEENNLRMLTNFECIISGRCTNFNIKLSIKKLIMMAIM